MEKYDLLFKNGTVVNASGSVKADVFVKDGKIAAIVKNGNPEQAARTIDASGKKLLPGVIDAHAHTDLVTYSDHCSEFTRAASCGGVTTIVTLVRKRPTMQLELIESLKRYIDDNNGTAHCDFAIHGGFLPGEDAYALVPPMVKMGITSFKMFMAYGARGFQLPDDFLIKAMDAAAQEGGLILLHAESGAMINHFEAKKQALGQIAPTDFGETRPGVAEAEAVYRGYSLAKSVKCPVYFVHQSAKESIPVLKAIREEGAIDVFAETCPQYLMLKDELMAKWGSLAKVAPPLREQEDLDAIWHGCQTGVIDVIGSDHAGYTKAVQHQDVPNIFTATFGMPVIEFMLETIHEEGVQRNRISENRMVQLLSENPAKIFGLYPQKGVLQVGSDADIVVFDPDKPHTLSADRMHSKSDYTCFEGMTCHGAPEQVYLRGNLVTRDMEPVEKAGIGRYLPRTAR